MGSYKEMLLDDRTLPMYRQGHSLVDQIGNTPLLRLPRLFKDFPAIEVYAKAEWFNPGGSVKDRAAWSMIREGERQGKLGPGKNLLDSTSGNTGIAYAMIGAARGYPVKLCLPTSASEERKRILKAYGAELILTPGDEGSDGAIRRVRQIYAEDPRKILLSRSVLEPGESRSPSRNHRRGNLGPDPRENHPFRCRTRNQRHVRGHRQWPEGIQSCDSRYQPPAGIIIPWPRRHEAHGHLHRPADLRP